LSEFFSHIYAVAKNSLGKLWHRFPTPVPPTSFGAFAIDSESMARTLILYCFVALLLFLSLFGRGAYKYYFAGVTPFAVPLFSKKMGALIFEAFSAAVILLPREVTPWMAVLLITLLPNLMQSRSSSVEVEQAPDRMTTVSISSSKQGIFKINFWKNAMVSSVRRFWNSF
jgi:hypothetical protein